MSEISLKSSSKDSVSKNVANYPLVSANDTCHTLTNDPIKSKPKINDVVTPSKKNRQKFKLPMTLKVSIWFGVPLLLGFGALSKLTFDSQRDFQNTQMDNFAHVISEQLAASSVEPLFAEANMELGILIQQIPLNGSLIGVGIYDHVGNAVAKAGELPQDPNLDFSLPKTELAAASFYENMGKQQAEIERKKLSHAILYSTPIRFRDVTGGYALVVFNQESLDERMRQMNYALFSISLILITFLAAIVLYFSHRITAPVRYIVDAANRIDRGDISPILERRNDELGQLINAINNMTKGLAEKSQIKRVLDKFLAPDIAAKIINELDTVDFRGENVNATVLFADIVGFTSMSERLTPEQVSDLLNEYFGYYSACAKLHFGTVDKFLGDCIMLVFGAVKNDDQHQYHAASCALLMQDLTAHINEMREQKGLSAIHLRIGINSGEMLAGLLGTRDRMEYTVIGDSVNLASRLCNEAQQGEIIIKEDMCNHLSEKHKVNLSEQKTIKVRGKEEPIAIYNLKNIEKTRTTGDRALMDDLLEKVNNSMTPI